MNTKKKYLIGIAVLFIAAILCMPAIGVSAMSGLPVPEDSPKPFHVPPVIYADWNGIKKNPLIYADWNGIKKNPLIYTDWNSIRKNPLIYADWNSIRKNPLIYTDWNSIKKNPPKPSFIKFNQPPYKHSQPPMQGKRMGMPNPNADTEQYEQLMEKYKSPEWEARRAAEGTITEQPGNLITYAYLPKQLIPFHPVYIIGSNPIWCYR